MQHPQEQRLSFSEFTLDLTRGCLWRGDQEIKLRPKSFETLKHLVENSGRLISKDELIAAVWPETSVTDDSLVQCLIDVRRALGENAQQIVKTVPRRGYIFDAEVTRRDLPKQLIYTDEVESLSVTIDEDVETELVISRRSWFRSRSALVMFALIIAALAGFTLWFVWRQQSKSSIPQIRTLAVLPFRSQIPDPHDDFLGLGIANEIITKVSQAGGLTVRPTSAVSKYTNKEVDAVQAARDFQLDAVVDGSYLRVDNQLRITVNLLRVSDGTSLWAEKFDQPFTDIFAIQDRVSQQVAQRLWLKLSPT